MCRTSHEVRGLKYNFKHDKDRIKESHLTRGAWIEIDNLITVSEKSHVAPHTRCVDWNNYAINPYKIITGRTSHEVRGLKLKPL